MDASERLADKYLRALNLGEVAFDPDGNVPPDFSIGGRVGVEVRRLNQNYIDISGASQGLEEVTIPRWGRMRSILKSLGPSVDGECWYVGVDYGRLFPEWKYLEARIRSDLGEFRRRSHRTRAVIQTAPNFELDLLRAGIDHGSFFVMGAGSDHGSGGWVMSEVTKNLRLCIAKKEKKIAPYRGKYDEWWLVLADHIGYSMEEEDRVVFREQAMPTIPHSFARIVFLDPRDNGPAFEV